MKLLFGEVDMFKVLQLESSQTAVLNLDLTGLENLCS